jgi:hypothetical protein
MESMNIRQARGSESPSEKGQGAVYFIPRSDMPEGDYSGEDITVCIDGSASTDEQGMSIKVERIYIKKHNESIQDKVEKGLQLEISLNKK